MTPFALKLFPTRTDSTRTAGPGLRDAFARWRSAGSGDPVHEPAGLRYPMSARARRLMRSGRVDGW